MFRFLFTLQFISICFTNSLALTESVSLETLSCNRGFKSEPDINSSLIDMSCFWLGYVWNWKLSFLGDVSVVWVVLKVLIFMTGDLLWLVWLRCDRVWFSSAKKFVFWKPPLGVVSAIVLLPSPSILNIFVLSSWFELSIFLRLESLMFWTFRLTFYGFSCLSPRLSMSCSLSFYNDLSYILTTSSSSKIFLTLSCLSTSDDL